MKPTLLILAAGVGSRYGGLKQIDKLGPTGETIIDYSVYDAYRAGFGKVVFVIRKSIEADFKEVIADKYSGKIEVDFVLQEIEYIPKNFKIPAERTKPWGTGHAILMAKDKIKEPFAVINGDDFYGKDAFITIANHFSNIDKSSTKLNLAMVGYRLENTLSENGFVSRGVCKSDENNFLTDINENTHIEKINNDIVSNLENNKKVVLDNKTPVSMNFWGLLPDIFQHLENLFIEFLKENSDNLKTEFYIPFAINDLINRNIAQVKVLDSSAEWFGVTYQQDREIVIERLKKLHQNSIYPTPLWK